MVGIIMKFKNKKEVIEMLTEVSKLLQGVRIGLAGSFSREENTEDSDIDIVYLLEDVHLNDDMSIDNAICKYLKDNKYDIENEFDILCLNYLEEHDIEMDDFGVKMGIGVNEDSTYKTIMRDVIWVT